MLGKLMGGMGDLGKVINAAMSGDKSGIVDMLRPHLPGILTAATTGIIQAAGGDPATDGAFLWHHTRRDGTATIMATVYRVGELGAPAEEVGTIDVLATLATLDLSQFIQ